MRHCSLLSSSSVSCSSYAISRPAAAHISATVSIVVKTLVLYTIMVTGAIWEKKVFGQYLFAPAFFWEDVMSFLVIALHTLYMAALIYGFLDTHQQMYVALAAYTAYVINAAQFLLEAARRAPRRSAQEARAGSYRRA